MQSFKPYDPIRIDNTPMDFMELRDMRRGLNKYQPKLLFSPTRNSNIYDTARPSNCLTLKLYYFT